MTEPLSFQRVYLGRTALNCDLAAALLQRQHVEKSTFFIYGMQFELFAMNRKLDEMVAARLLMPKPRVSCIEIFE